MWSLLSLKPKLIIAASVAFFFVCLYGAHWESKRQAVKKAVAQTQAAMSAEYTKKLLEASELAREREQVMVASAERIRKAKDAEIASLNARLGSALGSLSNRPQRPPSSPQGTPAPSVGAGATGAQLSREDAEFLVREAARADSLRLALSQCYRQYEQVRQNLK